MNYTTDVHRKRKIADLGSSADFRCIFIKYNLGKMSPPLRRRVTFRIQWGFQSPTEYREA